MDGNESAFDFEGWAILELMGHRKLGGYVRMSAALIRVDIHDREKPIATQWYGGHSLYCLTPVSEEIARRVSASLDAEPVTRWELALPAPPQPRDPGNEDGVEERNCDEV